MTEKTIIFKSKIIKIVENYAMYYESLRDKEQKLSSNEFVNLSFDLHFHRSIELICVKEGTLTIRSGLKTVKAEAGDILFVPAYFAHSATVSENCATNFIIPHNFYQRYKERGIPLYFSLLDNKEINRQIFSLIDLARDNMEDQQSLLLYGLTEAILGLIVKNYELETQDLRNTSNDFIIQVIDFIELNYKEDITLKSLAKHFKYSESHFSRLFNHGFGCNFNYYLNRIRYNDTVNNAGCSRKLSEVILAAGFRDVSAYYKFKKKYIDVSVN